MNILRAWGKRIASGVGVIFLLVLVLDLNSRMVHMLELRGELEAEQTRLDKLLAEEEALEEAIAYAESDEAIDEWAREENWMGHNGDIIVVPIPDGTVLEEHEIVTQQPQTLLKNWEAWMLWLTYRE